MCVIFGFAYLCGILWMFQCELYEDFYHDTSYKDLKEEDKPLTFITKYGIEHKNPVEGVLIVSYFALTSLSTVGFGDLVP